MNLEVLVVTMNASDFSLPEKMNLKCNTLITNQNGDYGYKEQKNIRMLSTATKGVGVNRNLGLALAQGDILLFSDDDVVYYDCYLEGVLDAFRKHPDADAVFFNMNHSRDGKVYCRNKCKSGRVRLWNGLNYGTSRIAIKRSALEKSRLSFSTLFGGGAKYGCGEDTIFIRDIFRSGLKVYSDEYFLGVCSMDNSSWFEGYNEKYVFDKGVFFACAFPNAKHILKFIYLNKTAKQTNLKVKKVLSLFNQGIKAYKSLDTYKI